MELIEDIWMPIWDGKITKYNGEQKLIYEMECKGGLFKIVAAQIYTTSNVFKMLNACNALYWLYLNDKQIWCYPVREDQLVNKFDTGFMWERKFMIPINISKGQVIRLEITDIKMLPEEKKCAVIGHGINAVLSSYMKKE